MVSRWPKSPFWYRDLFFGIEILYSVVQHLYRPLLGINLSVLFWASTSCKVEVKEDLDTEKKIEKSRYLKKDISIPTKRVTQFLTAVCAPSPRFQKESTWNGTELIVQGFGEKIRSAETGTQQKATESNVHHVGPSVKPTFTSWHQPLYLEAFKTRESLLHAFLEKKRPPAAKRKGQAPPARGSWCQSECVKR